MRWAEARTCHGEPGPAADPDAGDVRGHTVEDAAVLSPKACDLQDSLGQQRVPVVGGTVNHQHSTPGPRTLSITDTAHHPATVPVSLSSSQTHSGTLTGGHTCNSSLSNKQPHTHLLTDSSITSGSTSHPDTQSQQSCRNTTPGIPGVQAGLLQGPDTGLGLPPGHTMSLPVTPTQGSPLIVRVNGDPVLLPGDEGFGEPVDLALEAGHTALLAHGGLGMHVEV